MRAMVLKAVGGPENFELAEIAMPRPDPGEVLVRVHASALNPVDARIRNGLPIGPRLPAVLGADLSGTVEAVADDVLDFSPGDEVYGCAGGVRGLGGSFADYIAADARLLARKPGRLSMREAAAMPLVSITAWNCMARADVGAGDHVLVHAGCGGVGHVAVQLAKARGARVTATVSSSEKAAIAQDLGADHTVLYGQESVADYVQRLTAGRGFDVVIDTVGGANLDRSFQAAAIGGRIAATAARSTHDLSPLHAKALSLHVVFMLIPLLENVGREDHGRIMRDIAVMADSGKIRPLIDPARFGLDQLPNAFRHLESGRPLGKVVVDVM
ncbi:zinc-dependent alcohol dehydrogenase family protein [Mesorhizobium comanense]|uniref:zinc-dependent alcohol dehydrogenase family protein n=1 Tax=Mesorhizobium comanense TaxID=2502215 RepID=UPI0010F85AE4|nr:zinc-dependent alcohol dehydrogenase family protein [Mesorhizobium comanense]